MGFVRKPRRRCVFPTPEPDYKPHNGLGQKWDFEESLAAPFDLSQNQGMTAGDQAGAFACDGNPIVSDQPCEKASTFGRRDQGQGQAAFAGTGGTGNEHASFTDHDDTCMKIGFSHIDGRLIPLLGQERFPIRIKVSEHVGIEKVEHLFRNIL